jgi:hypothetical protein
MPTNPTPIPNPLINGYRWDFSALTFTASGAPLPGILDIDYAEELKKGEIYANGTPQKLGETVGQYKPSLSFTILALELENLLTAICAINGTPGSGYMLARFDVRVAKQDGSGLNLGPLYVDLCRGVSINKISSSFKTGQDALAHKIECSNFYLLRNGQSALTVNPANQFMTLG